MRLALLLLLWPALAIAEGPAREDVDIAHAHYNTGEINYQHGRFEDAAREFEEAYRLSGKAPLLYNMGKSYDGANNYARALDSYQRFLSAAPQDSLDRPFAEKRVDLLKNMVGKIALAGVLDGSNVRLDGAAAGTTPLPEALTVNPGRHRIEVTHEGYVTFRTEVDVRAAEVANAEVQQKENVKLVTIEKKDKPVYKKWWLWTTLVGALAAGGAVTAVVLTVGSSSTSGVPSAQLPHVQ
jgi:tetratricopeptide (TPR) repeat protein